MTWISETRVLLMLSETGLTDRLQTGFMLSNGIQFQIQPLLILPNLTFMLLSDSMKCGDFDIIHDWRGQNAGVFTATMGCENVDGTVATMLAGSPNFDYPAGPVSTDGADDIVYNFSQNAITYDISIQPFNGDLTTPNGGNFEGTMVNNGATTVTSFDVSYTVNGGNKVTASVGPVSVSTGNTYNFTHPTAFSGTLGQDHAIMLSVEKPNGQTDERMCNNSTEFNTFVNLGVSGDKAVLIEEFTGAWCGWCPDGRVVLDDLQDQFGNDIAVASVHQGDQMTTPEGNTIIAAFGPAYPQANIDRVLFPGATGIPISRGSWATETYEQAQCSYTGEYWHRAYIQ